MYRHRTGTHVAVAVRYGRYIKPKKIVSLECAMKEYHA
jgi:hypothetical protein